MFEDYSRLTRLATRQIAPYGLRTTQRQVISRASAQSSCTRLISKAASGVTMGRALGSASNVYALPLWSVLISDGYTTGLNDAYSRKIRLSTRCQFRT